jgi:ankyrin repeat protein
MNSDPSDSRSLPSRPSLEQYKKQAKELLKSWKANDPQALQRIRQHHPRAAKLSAGFVLADAQLVIAREHGFESWPDFAKHLSVLTRETFPDAVWKAAEQALIAGDDSTLERLLRDNELLFREQHPPAYGPEPGRLAPHYSGADARSIIASNHHFDTWARFCEYNESLKDKDSLVARFEAAVDAIVDGNVSRLRRLLRATPDLIRARSTRRHHSTLLHYIGANGVEDFRQKTPKKLLKITEILLDAGADPDAVADMYGGGCTTIGLVATSVHPYLAGLQNALMQILLDRGARIDQSHAGGNQQSAVISCLANGRGEAAVYLAERGAPLDLVGAAGVGRLDVVRSFFDDDGAPKEGVTRKQMESGLIYACGWGRYDVVEYLLRIGVDPGAMNDQQETGLHWAAVGGEVAVVKLLVEKGAPVEARDRRFVNTPLAWAIYGWRETSGTDERRPYEEIAAFLVAAGAAVRPKWLVDESVSGNSRMLAALSGGSAESLHS